MFDIIYMMLIFVSFINIKINGLNCFFDDYIDLKNTSCVRGIFVWMIFFRHFKEYCIIKNGNC